MAEITLLRHGQASFGADNYDRLSDLGHRQALWLGQNLRRLGKSFDRLVMGSMVRHRETAEKVMDGLRSSLDFEIHPGLNEYNFKELLYPLKQGHPNLWVESDNARRDYYYNIKHAMKLWMDGSIENDGEFSWQEFCQRVEQALEFACDTSAKRILIVTSGGPISVVLGKVLRLDNQGIREIALQIKNSSTSTLLYNRTNFALDNFNDVSHLLEPDKLLHITFS